MGARRRAAADKRQHGRLKKKYRAEHQAEWALAGRLWFTMRVAVAVFLFLLSRLRCRSLAPQYCYALFSVALARIAHAAVANARNAQALRQLAARHSDWLHDDGVAVDDG